MSRQVRIMVYEGSEHEDGWPPEDAVKCVGWFTEKLNSIPAEYMASALIEFTGVSDYGGCSYVCLDISYTRPETHKEKFDREEWETLRVKEQKKVEHKELCLLAELKAKYEGR